MRIIETIKKKELRTSGQFQEIPEANELFISWVLIGLNLEHFES